MSSSLPPNGDVRMKGFSRRTTVAEAIRWLDAQSTPLGMEMVPLEEAFGRVLAQPVVSPIDVPQFNRSMMDGFALQAADTMGASAYQRLSLEVIGQSMPGAPFSGCIEPGQAVRIMTGAPIPCGADAVLPVEMVEIVENRILVVGEVSPDKHIGHIAEDIARGTTVLTPDRYPVPTTDRGMNATRQTKMCLPKAAQRLIRPQDVGVLASIGIAQVPVVRQPRVRLVITGNELVPAGSMPGEDKIVDSNGPMLAALVARDGGLPMNPGILPDRPDVILDALRSQADLIVVAGGTSVGQEDYVPSLLREQGELPIHGIAMRPSSPTGLGVLDSRLVFLLPGNPVSCLCAYDFFAGRVIRALGGRNHDWPYRRIRCRLARKIVSTVGRLDYMRVRLQENQVEPLAIGGASVLSSTTRADGFVLVPPDSEGYPPGKEVEVFLYQ